MAGNSNSKFNHIVITGASSGIGEALALYYAAQGVRLSLTGRDAGRLAGVADQCRERGAHVAFAVLSVTDREGMRDWLQKIDADFPVDLVIANAGISAGMGKSKGIENPEQVREIFSVNVTGVFNTIEPLLPRMVERGNGHIVLMSSLAGFRGWPSAPAYSASKAAVRAYGEALLGALARTGVRMHVVTPGFVHSRITDVNDFPMPFIMTSKRAAEIIVRGIERGRGRIAFPLITYFFVWLLSALPDCIAVSIQKGLPTKRELIRDEK